MECFVGRDLNGGRNFHLEVGGGETLFGGSLLHLRTHTNFYNADYQSLLLFFLQSSLETSLVRSGQSGQRGHPFFATPHKPFNEEIEHVIIRYINDYTYYYLYI